MRCHVIHVVCHLESQVSNLAFELNLSHWTRTIGVEVIYDSLSCTQLVSGDP